MGKLREAAFGLDPRGGGGGGGRGHGRRSSKIFLAMPMAFVFMVFLIVTLLNSTPLSLLNQAVEEKEDADPLGPRRSQRGEGAKSMVVNPYTPVRPNAQTSSGWPRTWLAMLPGEPLEGEEFFYCHRSHIRTDVCRLHGLVQLAGENASSFILHAAKKSTALGEEKLRPYTRKWEKHCMSEVGQVTLKSEPAAVSGSGSGFGNRAGAGAGAGAAVAALNLGQICQVRHKVPTVVFSTGGFTGNVYHEFNDGLIPLYITTQHLKGEVVFIIVDYHDWWMRKYQEVLKRLSKYEAIDIANHTESHCFADATVGLFIHEELGIDHTLMPNRESIQDFRAMLSDVYPLENSGWEEEFPTFRSTRPGPKPGPGGVGAVPQLVIIKREGNRMLLNEDEVISVATGLGFDVTILQPDPTTEMKKIFWVLDRCDVLVGVHGAALTHFLFVRPGAVFIQIVPLGTDWAARTYYGDPAKRLGLHYIEYRIAIEESSLSREYEDTDPVLLDPEAVIQRGWSVIKEIYLTKQNVELSLPRFRNTLEDAKAKWWADPAPMSENIARAVPYYRKRRRKVPTAGGKVSQAMASSSSRGERSSKVGLESLR